MAECSEIGIALTDEAAGGFSQSESLVSFKLSVTFITIYPVNDILPTQVNISKLPKT